jgi:hypothetical protein
LPKELLPEQADRVLQRLRQERDRLLRNGLRRSGPRQLQKLSRRRPGEKEAKGGSNHDPLFGGDPAPGPAALRGGPDANVVGVGARRGTSDRGAGANRQGGQAMKRSEAIKTFLDLPDESVKLLPARTDARWFHGWIYGKAEIRFIKGRLKFGDGKNSAPFPSMVVIYR